MHAGATSGAAGPSSPRHTVLPPPPGGPDDAAERTVDLTEPGLVDVMLLDHRHEILLFNRFTVVSMRNLGPPWRSARGPGTALTWLPPRPQAAAQGNTHVMELLVGALAVDIRLHSQVGQQCMAGRERSRQRDADIPNERWSRPTTTRHPNPATRLLCSGGCRLEHMLSFPGTSLHPYVPAGMPGCAVPAVGAAVWRPGR